MNETIVIRPVHTTDLPFLEDMLYEAMAVAEEVRLMGKAQALALPSARKYLEGWGRFGDAGVIAMDQSDYPLGAAWYRLFPLEAGSYGYVAANVPELTIGVSPDARGQGIGHALLQALTMLAQDQDYEALSLSVDRQNPALRLYEQYGFRDAGISTPTDTSVTMLKKLTD